MTIMGGGPLGRDREWKTFDGVLFTVRPMISTDKKKITQAGVKLRTTFAIKLLRR